MKITENAFTSKSRSPARRQVVTVVEDRSNFEKLGKHSQGNDLVEKKSHERTRKKSEKMRDEKRDRNKPFDLPNLRPTSPKRAQRTKFDELDEIIQKM